MTEIDEELL